MRLRNLVQLIGLNVALPGSSSNGGGIYYTLHLTTMSAPFYTSERIDSANPKWLEFDTEQTAARSSSAEAVVVRLWQRDAILLTVGVHLSGLVHLGNRLADIQPSFFRANTLVYQLSGGYFADCASCKPLESSSSSSGGGGGGQAKPPPFYDSLNVRYEGAGEGQEEARVVFRRTGVRISGLELRTSYTVQLLQKLHNLQKLIKNKSLETDAVREKISLKCGLLDVTRIPQVPPSSAPRPSNLLTMSSLNKLLHKKEMPTWDQKLKKIAIQKQIESVKFRIKLLLQEKDRKSSQLRQILQICTSLQESNEDKESDLMESYRQLSKDWEQLRDLRRSYAERRELLLHAVARLRSRQKRLVAQLPLIYPIEAEAEAICGVRLPDAEQLDQCPERDVSVALGCVAHVLLMCSAFLQAPLRYPVLHLGSRSRVLDHITPSIPDKDREFPLYVRGKDRPQFHYAVYLLNKNIAQLRWLCGLATQDLRATLPNTLGLLRDMRLDDATPSAASLALPHHSAAGISHYAARPRATPTAAASSSSSAAAAGLGQYLKSPRSANGVVAKEQQQKQQQQHEEQEPEQSEDYLQQWLDASQRHHHHHHHHHQLTPDDDR